MNLFNRNKPSRIRKAVQVAGNAEEPEEVGVEATESGPGELMARKVEPKSDAVPIWRKRGLFAVGGVFGAPRTSVMRKNTK